MKKLIIILSLLILVGCGSTKQLMSSYHDMLRQIPNNEFKQFEYHRTGMYSSAHIVAKDGAKDGDLMMIQSLDVTLDYGPEHLNMSMEGFIKEVSE